MSDNDEQEDGKETAIGKPRQMEMVTRIGFFIGLVIMLIVLFRYIGSIGTESETWMLLNLLVMLGLTTGMGFIWRRNHWKMRRAALEEGFD